MSTVKTAPYLKGDLLRLGPWHGATNIQWRDNVPFHARLTVLRKDDGGSASHFWFEDEAGQRLPMHAADLVNALKKLNTLPLEGMWEVCRRGPAYGIRLAA